MKIQFTSEELAFIKARGSDVQKIEEQFKYFEKGFPFIHLLRAATLNDGIKKFSDEELTYYNHLFEIKNQDFTIEKFVPASGAASRMFKDLQPRNLTPETQEKFRQNIQKFAFYTHLKTKYNQIGSWNKDLESENIIKIINFLLEEEGLNYNHLPKALLDFHSYDTHCRTALEEHFVEAALYGCGANRECRLHFTITPQHLNAFQELINKKQKYYEQRFNVHYTLTYSIQSPSTDTLAATPSLQPFRDKNGILLFRPGGHGALINNLNQINSDIVFIKNIDNVIREEKISDTIKYKKALAGYLLSLQTKVFAYQQLLSETEVDKETCREIQNFAEKHLQITFRTSSATQETLFKALHRPIRVCGMVKNEGEPGGGPFWVKNKEGEVSCQIVEKSQIDIHNTQQQAILTHATHFNPVDMVCSFHNFRGEKFDLMQFIDPETGFISEKTHEGIPLKAMELPGLWNGAMAQWITIFIEVPLSTFQPVKSVFDLLKH